jgi:hypothetical protein
VGAVIDLVVVEAVPLVPKPAVAGAVHRIDDLDEVFEEFRRHVLVGGLHRPVGVAGEFERHREHGVRVKRHPGRAVGLTQLAAAGNGLAPVEDADVVEAEEAAGEKVFPVGILAVDPPGEVEEQFLENTFEETPVARAARGGNLVDAPRGPGVDRRVDVAEFEFVGRDLAVGMHIPFAQKQRELLLRERGIDARHRHHVKREIPGGKPRVFPLVGHGDDVAAVEMGPVAVAAELAGRRRSRRLRIALEPVLDGKVIKLLGPQEAGIALADDVALVGRGARRNDAGVEFVRLALGAGEFAVEVGTEGERGCGGDGASWRSTVISPPAGTVRT